MSSRSTLNLFADGRGFGDLEVVVLGFDVVEFSAEVVNLAVVVHREHKGLADRDLDLAERDAEGLDRALQALEQIDRHQLLEALLAAGLAEVAPGGAALDVVEVDVLLHLARG